MFSVLIYGFDFSDNNYPNVGMNLSNSVIEYLNNNDIYEAHYSGCSTPRYIGCKVGIIDPTRDCDAVKVVNDAVALVEANKQAYIQDINDHIDQILEDLQIQESENVSSSSSYFLKKDIEEAIIYFNLLKTIEPTIKTLIATS